ncbi:O-methyltransferase [Allopusillimonas ginsengisoli]|uniref:O-methyltransferase n=1 Tax=Allopusillimonas ginsengisoli TaxID=453575 RepID=UPI00101EC5B6|nr:O-methyltransferase [Allopusillimonas ginsengisoli]TEA77011.1 O-methyltransferase [Allopusillimonas ginsengisoli]
MRTPNYPGADAHKWAAVDDYFSELLAPQDEALTNALSANAEAGMPSHDVSAVQGKFLALLVKLMGARHVLEIGTLGGYSTIWMARALKPEGRVTSIEIDPLRANVALENCRAAGCADKVDIRVGAASDVLPRLEGPFDLVFIDADKPNNPVYLEWALKLTRPGSVIVGDNVVRGGAVVDRRSTDPNVLGVRRFAEMLAADPRLDSTALQTVGEKGWDGFTVSFVKG